jgi:hypothetical protein
MSSRLLIAYLGSLSQHLASEKYVDWYPKLPFA